MPMLALLFLFFLKVFEREVLSSPLSASPRDLFPFSSRHVRMRPARISVRVLTSVSTGPSQETGGIYIPP